MTDKPYTVPGGIKLFFEEGASGVLGYRDLGNLTATGMESAIEKLEHFTNRGGQRQKDAEAVQQSSFTIKFSFDEPNAYNLRWAFLGGDKSAVNAGSYSVVRELVQLTGVAAIRVAMTMAAVPAVVVQAISGSPTTYALTTDYTVQAGASTITRVNGGAITAGDFVMVSYSAQIPAHTKFPVLQSPIINGRARLLIQPTTGAQMLWEIPRCTISPDGAFSLDDTNWMEAAMVLGLLADTDNNPTKPFGEIHTWVV